MLWLASPVASEMSRFSHPHVARSRAGSPCFAPEWIRLGAVREADRRAEVVIGEALEISIVVSMLVLVGYPSALLAVDSLRERRPLWRRLLGAVARP